MQLIVKEVHNYTNSNNDDTEYNNVFTCLHYIKVKNAMALLLKAIPGQNDKTYIS